MAQLPQDYADNVETNNIQNTDDLVTEEYDANTWTASEPMSLLPTEIYCGNSLDPATRSKIFQTEPRNRDISSTPLKMEIRVLSVMSHADKETDRNYSKLLYRTSSVLRPIDTLVWFMLQNRLMSHENW
ncbi:hypothetical protein GLOIN_2v1776890 [Rhizophagus irregularis DAOM 181602=DAOM 197198]|uniref:Uncharacterized protein n=1 Tax=Rhizophagus irregularis (strain DAOM 181602 / DAOM 197198 / MUCL 43194) TaxID=747089 RepID=A0A2P4PW12_RHIID|nr:hypothetical protein GLOIN_2v1776890 [Rhizophagus irregularis DAOM 181602=DAOM 197198]POG69560.1 hypothetical protein GLOIN_2v1776890 [Rhizophagus irregularis DAOM 181602=DAOM 197198]GET66617.1 hypothetical protein GLOIN_2v1776890 [Rhizophagus irregularis DAOM 181602=DAOM 197198]|eukprot:XP_025176426.1 hypothetical protein GLOIN_2v1776890 [Rhizophagus irregularis DAOM 181602=DAOM 197198]